MLTRFLLVTLLQTPYLIQIPLLYWYGRYSMTPQTIVSSFPKVFESVGFTFGFRVI